MPELAELVSYLDGLPEPHIVSDRDYRIVAANRAYRERFGEPRKEMVGRTCHAVSHGIDVPCNLAGEACPRAAAESSGKRERVLHLHHTPRGEEYVQIELTPVRGGDGEFRYFVERMEPLLEGAALPGAGGLVGQSPAFRAMLGLLHRVAATTSSVLLLGESGTGKELVAHALHSASARAAHAFVPVDCSGLPETLFESELFGHERGAFTGATAQKPGLVEAAAGGTLFIDEVGDIPLGAQVKLLRLLETGTFRRVGSTELRHADIRVVSATHRDLPAMIASGQFRADLYYRISTFPIRLPPLRERVGDVPLLIDALLTRLAPGKRVRAEADALARLAAHEFPGNVRELRNLLERALLLGDGRALRLADVQSALALDRAPPAGEVATARSQGRAAEARAQGISVRTLYRRLAAGRQPRGPD